MAKKFKISKAAAAARAQPLKLSPTPARFLAESKQLREMIKTRAQDPRSPLHKYYGKRKSGQDTRILRGAGISAGHAGRGKSDGSTTGGINAPTSRKPPNEGGGAPPTGEYRGSEFQRNRAAAIGRISQ